MADSIIKDLNKQLAGKVANIKPAGNNLPSGGVSSFDAVLKNKRQGAIFEKIEQTFLEDSSKDKMQVLNAEDIKIDINEAEFGSETNFDGKKAVMDMFSTINDDSLKMDSIIEVLSSDDVKLSRRQILAYQASIGTLTVNTDLVSKLAQSVSQNLMTFFQMNLG